MGDNAECDMLRRRDLTVMQVDIDEYGPVQIVLEITYLIVCGLIPLHVSGTTQTQLKQKITVHGRYSGIIDITESITCPESEPRQQT
jgi:hypothetical protein